MHPLTTHHSPTGETQSFLSLIAVTMRELFPTVLSREARRWMISAHLRATPSSHSFLSLPSMFPVTSLMASKLNLLSRLTLSSMDCVDLNGSWVIPNFELKAQDKKREKVQVWTSIKKEMVFAVRNLKKNTITVPFPSNRHLSKSLQMRQNQPLNYLNTALKVKRLKGKL